MFVYWTNDNPGMTGMEPEHLRKYFCVIKFCSVFQNKSIKQQILIYAYYE